MMTLDEIRDNWPARVEGTSQGVYTFLSAKQAAAVNEMGRLLRTPGELATLLAFFFSSGWHAAKTKAKTKRKRTRAKGK